eukprot:8201255-Pyramimonas_sp.AAC.1
MLWIALSRARLARYRSRSGIGYRLPLLRVRACVCVWCVQECVLVPGQGENGLGLSAITTRAIAMYAGTLRQFTTSC